MDTSTTAALAATIELSGPYRPRPIRFLEVAELDGWRMKVYGITVRGERPNAAVVEAGKRIARERLPQPPFAPPDRYGVGVLIIHEGREGPFVLVDWWTGENMIQHHAYMAPWTAPDAFEYISPTGISVCVWELRVQAFERQAWIDCVLANPAGPDLDAYLARQLNEDV